MSGSDKDSTQAQVSEAPPVTGLYIGDCGELPQDTRHVLVQLLSGPSLDAKRHTRLWPVLLRDEAVLRSRLSDMFLDLVIDRDVQVGFVRQAEAGDLDTPRLLRRAQLTFMDSILVLHLRQQLIQAQSHGERAVVSTADVTEAVSVYDRKLNTDRAGFTKRITASIEKMKKHNILQKVRSSDDRFEVSPTLKLLFSAEEIQALTALYNTMASDSPEPEREQSSQREASQ